MHSTAVPKILPVPSLEEGGDCTRNTNVPKIVVREEEDAGEDEKSLPEVPSESSNENKEVEILNNRSSPIISSYSPPLSDGADLMDELPEKLQKIQNEASLINSPASKNVFIDRSYWEMVGTASVNMEWNN